MELERRYASPGAGACEVRAGASGPMIVGYAAVFGSPSDGLPFIETINPAAFDKTLTEADVRALGNHEPSFLLGRSKPGTLRLAIDQTGLRYEIDVNQADPDGQRAIEKVRRGDWDGSSFAFEPIRDVWDWQADPPTRELLEVRLVDVGPCTWPAYTAATSAARAAVSNTAARTRLAATELLARAPAGFRELALADETAANVRAAEVELELLALAAGVTPQSAEQAHSRRGR